MEKHEFCLEDVQDAMNTVINSGGEFRFYPKGVSMLPLIRQGIDSISLVSAQDKLNKYDLPLYVRSNGQFVLHRVMGQDGNGYILCGDNQLYLEHGIKHEQIRAKVCAIYRGDRRIDVTNKAYIFYCRLWCFMPLRWVIFLPRRIIKKLFAKKSV